jgi:hypothetical protein
MGGAVQHLALLGKDQPTGMAVEQGHGQVGLKRRNLTADGRL